MVVLIMGVSGSGKTAVGRALAAAVGWDFLDADDFHSPGARAAMASGAALTDEDRWPWLARVRCAVAERVAAGRPVVVACSALKRAYRDAVVGGFGGVAVVYLRGAEGTIRARMERREHFFPPEMLRGQFGTLEEPSEGEAVAVGIERPVGEIVAEIRARLGA